MDDVEGPFVAKPLITADSCEAFFETCDVLIVLVDHDAFKAVPLAERAAKAVYDTRGIWLDQPKATQPERDRLKLAS